MLNKYDGTKIEITCRDDSFSFVGPQLLSERIVRMTCSYRGDSGPACFKVGDHSVEARISNIISDSDRGMTSIGNSFIKIRQIEHILSALNGMGALDTNIELEFVDKKENAIEIMPPVAGLNSQLYANAILSSFKSIKENYSPGKLLKIQKAYVFREENNIVNDDPGVAIFAPSETLHITTQVNFPYFWGKQIYAQKITPLDYAKSISWARSFFSTPYPHKQSWDRLRERYPAVLRDIENHHRSVMLDYNNEKWITPPIVNTEPVRHKMLDFIGDLALLGIPIRAGIYIYKPSHSFNAFCVSKLLSELNLTPGM